MAAEQFFQAAELLWSTDGLDLNKCVFPLLVNYALAAELSLKAAEAFVIYGGVTSDGLIGAATTESAVRGHNLELIFASLQQRTQQAIAQRFLATTDENLERLLARCASYFEDARYPYEKKAGAFDLTGVRLLARGLLDAVRHLEYENA